MPFWTPKPGFFRAEFTDRIGDAIETGVYASILNKSTGAYGRAAIAGGKWIGNPGSYGAFSTGDRFVVQMQDHKGNSLSKAVTIGSGGSTNVSCAVQPNNAMFVASIERNIVRCGVVG
jgi:hypothetical protein